MSWESINSRPTFHPMRKVTSNPKPKPYCKINSTEFLFSPKNVIMHAKFAFLGIKAATKEKAAKARFGMPNRSCCACHWRQRNSLKKVWHSLSEKWSENENARSHFFANTWAGKKKLPFGRARHFYGCEIDENWNLMEVFSANFSELCELPKVGRRTF